MTTDYNHQLNIAKITKKTTKKAPERYQGLFKEDKEKKQQYEHERYKNILEVEKQRLVEYIKKYSKMRKNASL